MRKYYYDLRETQVTKIKLKKGGGTLFDENLFRAKVAYHRLTLAEVANKIGINEATLHKKIKNGGFFTRAEIYKLIHLLELNYDETMQIFFADKLA